MSRIDLYPSKNSSPNEAEIQTGTVINDKIAADVNVVAGEISGTFQPAGLKTAIQVSVHYVSDIPSKITPTPLANRNAMSIRVWGENAVFFGETDMVNTVDGYPKLSLEELALDIQDTNPMELWVVCEPGKTSELRIMEIA